MNDNVASSVSSATHPTTTTAATAATTTTTTATATATTTTAPTPSKKRKRLDFQDPAALKCLTKTLLHHDFQLNWDMPLNRLCPALTVRLNYLHWIEDLLATMDLAPVASNHGDAVSPSSSSSLSSSTTSTPTPSSPPRLGLDIGTGASIIYPLLGCQLHAAWHFVATEVDMESIAVAQQNIDTNHLNHRIRIVPVLQPLATPILAPLNHQRFSFTMCNPPFFKLTKILPFDTATGQSATSSETITSGGEVSFVSQMVDESLQWKHQCGWFTSMFGKKSSVKPVYDKLKAMKEITSIQTTRLVQGKTSRWAIAWSYVVGVPNNESAMAKEKNRKHLRQSFCLATDLDRNEAHRRILECLERNESLAVRYGGEEGEGKGEGKEAGGGRLVVTETNGAFEVEVVVSDEKRDPKNGSKDSIHVAGCVDDALVFGRFMDKLKKDVNRTGRYWRRKMSRT